MKNIRFKSVIRMGLLVLLFLCAGPVSGQKSGGRHHHAYRTGGKARPDWVQIVNPHDVRMDEIRDAPNCIRPYYYFYSTLYNNVPVHYFIYIVKPE